MGWKVGYLPGFCHHHLAAMSTHMHAYHYCVFESGKKIGLWTIPLCRKDIVLLHKHKEQQ